MPRRCPRRPQWLPKWKPRLRGRRLGGRKGALDFVPKALGWGAGGSGVLRGARAAGVGVGRGCSLQGASAGLRGRQQRGRAAISGVCVEVQPPVSFAQRQIISFAKTGAFPPPETQGDRSRQSGSRRRGKRDRAELRTRAAPRAAPPPLRWAGLAEREVRGGPSCFRGLQHPNVGSLPGPAMQVCVTSAAPSTACRPDCHVAVLLLQPPAPRL